MEQVTTWSWPILSYLGYPDPRIPGDREKLWHICVIMGQPISCGEITACADVAQLCSSSNTPLAPQTLLLQASVVTSHPWQLFAGLHPKNHLWALISPISAGFPADSWWVFIIQRNSAQTPRGFLGDAVTPRLWLREQANGSPKQAQHPHRAAENRDSWPCLHTNALSFLGQEPGILRASG